MNEKINFLKQGLRNISYTFIAQGINLVISLVKVLFIPKLIGINDFSYWQLYVFYSGYVGFFQFGLNDGIYLRYGGHNYKDLDKSVFRSQFWLLLFSQIIISLCMFWYSGLFLNERAYIIKLTSVCLVLSGISTFFWFVFQGTNRIKEYAIAITTEKMIFLFGVVIMIISNESHYQPFLLIDILSKLMGLIVCITFGRDLIIGKVTSLKIALTEVYSNMSVGLKLMLANISSMLILGIGRYVIDYVWGVTVFGELALMLSIVSMFLLFINATSIALFPALRRISVKELPKTYVSIRNILMGLLLSILILYVPAKILLNIWFPEYQDSIKYLSILLPLCIFDGKMQMLVSTYLKVIRKENSLLIINIICVLLSALLCISTAIIFKNLTGVIISMVVAVFIRSIIAEVYLALQLKVSLIRSVFYETLLILTFSITSWYLIDTINIIIYLIFYLIFLVSIRKEVNLLSGIIKNVKSAK